MITKLPSLGKMSSPADIQQSTLIVCALAGAVVLSATIGHELSLGVIGVLAILTLMALPYASPEASLIILGFTGRSELPPFLTGNIDVAFVAGSGLALAASLRAISVHNHHRSIHWSHPIVVSHFMLFILVAVYWVGMQGSEYAVEKTYRVLVFGPLLLLLPPLLLNTSERMFRFLWQFVTFVGILAAVSVALAVAANGITGILRISPPGGGPITLARMTGLAAIACVGLFIADRHRKVAGITTLALVAITFATGSRGPALFLGPVFLIAILTSVANRHTRRSALALIAGSIIGTFAVWFGFSVAVSKGLPFARRYMLLFSEDRGTSVTSRTEFLEQALYFARNTNFAGSGTGSWPELVGSPLSRAYPHNIFAEYLVEQGALGVILFMISLIAVIVTATLSIARQRSKDEMALSIVGATSYLYAILIAQTSGDIYDNRYLWFYAGFVLCCCSLGKSYSASTNSYIADSFTPLHPPGRCSTRSAHPNVCSQTESRCHVG